MKAPDFESPDFDGIDDELLAELKELEEEDTEAFELMVS
jgi:hypothetical protein